MSKDEAVVDEMAKHRKVPVLLATVSLSTTRVTEKYSKELQATKSPNQKVNRCPVKSLDSLLARQGSISPGL